MNIISLEASNFMRLKALRIAPNGEPVVIGGRNAQGKSSLLRLIMAALGGKKYLPAEPVRSGADEAKASFVLSDGITVDWSITADGKERISLRGPHGAIKNERTVLAGLFGAAAFDPLAFDGMKPAEQAKALRALVGIDTASLDAEIARLYAERLDIGRDGKAADGAATEMPYYADAPAERVDPSALVAQLTALAPLDAGARQADELARTHAESSRSSLASIASARAEIAAREAKIAQWREQIERDEAWIAYMTSRGIPDAEAGAECSATEAEKATARAAELRAEVEAKRATIQAELATAGERNAKIDANERKAAALRRAEDLRVEWKGKSAAIADVDARKAAMLDAVTWPVPGLGFTPDGVTYNGHPFEQASQAERMRVSVAIGAAGGDASGTRIMLIQNASLLDEEGLASLLSIAAEYGVQPFIERVGHGDECTVVIEDGEVAE